MPCAVAFLADEQGGQDVVLPIVLHGGGGSIPREEGAGRPVDGFNWGFLPVCEPRLLTERRKAFHAIRRRRQFRRECLIWLKSFEKRILQLDFVVSFLCQKEGVQPPEAGGRRTVRHGRRLKAVGLFCAKQGAEIDGPPPIVRRTDVLFQKGQRQWNGGGRFRYAGVLKGACRERGDGGVMPP